MFWTKRTKIQDQFTGCFPFPKYLELYTSLDFVDPVCPVTGHALYKCPANLAKNIHPCILLTPSVLGGMFLNKILRILLNSSLDLFLNS